MKKKPKREIQLLMILKGGAMTKIKQVIVKDKISHCSTSHCLMSY